MELTFTPNDRGQVGIGTLIVFIAMVLVAAIAAGVLINTAGFLQTQAEDTGTESTEQVANNLNVITEVGTVADDGEEETINEVLLGVQPAAGSDDINLEELSIQYVSDESFSNLVHVKDVSVDENNEIVGENTVFNTQAVTAEDGEDNVMTDNADRYEIVIPLEQGIDDIAAADDGNGEEGDLGLFYEVVDDTPATDNPDPDEEENQVAVIDDNDDAVAIIEFDDEVDPSALATFGEDFGDNDADTLDESFINGLDNTNLEELVEGEEAELTYTTETGAQTVTILQVPDSLAGEDGGDTVDL